MGQLAEVARDWSPAEVQAFLAEADQQSKLALLRDLYDWTGTLARESQLEPEGDWSTWLLNCGRGFGKSRVGAEFIRKRMESGLYHRAALVARTTGDVRDVVVEGESGLLRICPPWSRPLYEPSKRRLTWPRPQLSKADALLPGARVGGDPPIATTFSADEPKLLRGPQFDVAWVDELASWKTNVGSGELNAWENLQFGLRLGEDPRCVATTTPRPVRIIRELMKDPTCVVTGGSTYENAANLAPKFYRDVISKYEGTSKGRQEIFGEVLDEAEGALWKRSLFDNARADEIPDLDRIVVAADPAVSSTEQSDETGIVIAGVVYGDPDHFYVLADRSGHYSPNEWAGELVTAYQEFRADRIVGETNNGGDMIESTVRTVAKERKEEVAFRKVWASRGKAARAEPIVALYEQRRVHHAGIFDDLEDQCCNWEPQSGTRSPDRLDALVWAITELMESRPTSVPSLGDDVTGVDREESPWSL